MRHYRRRSIFLPGLSSLAAVALMLMLAVLHPPGAVADDSTAALGADGLRLRRSDAVAMKSEALTITPDRIHIRYVFRSYLKRPERTFVAFPLPLIPISEEEERLILPERKGAPEDIVNFRLVVDGRPVQPKMQVRALVNGIDRSAILRKYGLPFVVLPRKKERDALIRMLQALPPAAREELERHGLVEWRPAGKYGPRPVWHWELEVLYYWEQVFPPDRDVVITHEYTPIAGKFLYSEGEPWVRKTFCTDDAFRAAARRLRTKGTALVGTHVEFILTTGNNWAGPIKDFRLVIDKKRPDALVSLCWRGRLRKISPTRFEFSARDFSPREDLHVMFLEPFRPGP